MAAHILPQESLSLEYFCQVLENLGLEKSNIAVPVLLLSKICSLKKSRSWSNKEIDSQKSLRLTLSIDAIDEFIKFRKKNTNSRGVLPKFRIRSMAAICKFKPKLVIDNRSSHVIKTPSLTHEYVV